MRTHFSTTTGHQRLLYGLAVGVATVALPLPLAWPTQVLLAWCLGALTFVALAWWLAWTFNAQRTRERAQAQDQPGLMLFVLLFLSVFASAGAIAMMLQHLRDLSATQRLGHLTLSMAALGASWLLMQTIFAFRYAHRYYQLELSIHLVRKKRLTLQRNLKGLGKSYQCITRKLLKLESSLLN